MDHGIYDKRHYPIVDVEQGYGEWVRYLRAGRRKMRWTCACSSA